MADSDEVFKAKVTTELVDHGEGLAKLKLGLVDATKVTHKLNRELAQVHHESAFQRLHEHLRESNKLFHEMGEHVRSSHERISELLPALSALGAVGSMAGIFETVEHAAEGYGELAHTAESLGMSVGALQVWNTVAKLTDTNAEGMDKALSKLNRTLGEVAVGKAKDVGALFKHLHMDPRQFHDAADALPVLADAFVRTHGKGAVAMRARMAQALFGRGGVEMIPMLMQGGAKLRQQMTEGRKLTFSFAGYGEGLEHYNESMKKLGLSVHAFTDELGAKLAPALQPIVDDMQKWITANRDWVTTAITDDVKDLSSWIKDTDWHHVGEEIDKWTKSAKGFVSEIGGAKTAIEALAVVMAARTVFSIASEIRDMVGLGRDVGGLAIRITRDLVPAWRKVEDAALAASAAERAASAGGGLGAGGGGLAFPVASLALNLFNLSEMTDENAFISKDSVRADPSLARRMTAEQLAKLPEHGGLLSADQNQSGHSFVGDNLARAWHAIAGEPAHPPGPGAPTSLWPWHDASTHLMPAWDSKMDWRTDLDDGETDDRRIHPHVRNSVMSGVPPREPRFPDFPHAPSGPPNRVEVFGQATVTVFLPNAPPGTTVVTTGTGVLAKPTVEVGQAFHDHFPRRK